MNFKKYISGFTFLLITNFFCSTLQAQHSGNIVYRNTDNYYEIFSNKSVRKFAITDSDMQVSVSVLLNQRADKFMITFGVSQEAKTPKMALAAINERITKFTSQFKQYGISKENVFVDFISQTKLYDFQKTDKATNTYEQLEKGFLIKKNVIVSVNKNELIEQLIAEASESEIYDIVKVEYQNNDMEAIYANLLKEANNIIAKKQSDYVQRYNPRIIGRPVVSDKFYYSFPNDQYKQYEAAESSSLEGDYNSYYMKKIARKNKTAYYDGINYAGFDKVINNADPEPCIQYVLTLSVGYALEKQVR
ncbi:SIMPL domain-containing protein [Ferruginibacter sp. HRS2-29]|uniref:SIMPL domain-containing protein n=1 Tax=Ferruginibacter sp. HRS2-29 TaxID=2487334 RepID=UPI0020CEA95E|nr:SIMPL domain-containing protein [Ferruginibacter sp. HRS2-29]MCP9751142.1 DUF541 domain-containing protein [Ferruginibacter sp. HRS2-29]